MKMEKTNLYLALFFAALLLISIAVVFGAYGEQFPIPPPEEEVAVEEEEEPEEEVYTGTAEGYIDDITVEVAVIDGEITDIEVTEHDETPDYFDDAVPEITDRIIDAQSTEVDIVSGATGTSEGIMSAVDEALADVELEEEEGPE